MRETREGVELVRIISMSFLVLKISDWAKREVFDLWNSCVSSKACSFLLTTDIKIPLTLSIRWLTLIGLRRSWESLVARTRYAVSVTRLLTSRIPLRMWLILNPLVRNYLAICLEFAVFLQRYEKGKIR